jgi:hypothetical protein
VLVLVCLGLTVSLVRKKEVPNKILIILMEGEGTNVISEGTNWSAENVGIRQGDVLGK